MKPPAPIDTDQPGVSPQAGVHPGHRRQHPQPEGRVVLPVVPAAVHPPRPGPTGRAGTRARPRVRAHRRSAPTAPTRCSPAACATCCCAAGRCRSCGAGWPARCSSGSAWWPRRRRRRRRGSADRCCSPPTPGRASPTAPSRSPCAPGRRRRRRPAAATGWPACCWRPPTCARCRAGELTEADAVAAGEGTLGHLLRRLGNPAPTVCVWRVELRYLGQRRPRRPPRAGRPHRRRDRGAEGPSRPARRPLADRAVDAHDAAAHREVPRRRQHRARPSRASRNDPAFKINVRKLKEMGLTESLDIGYRLSPRGEALLRSLG